MKTSYGRSMTSLASRRGRPRDIPAVLPRSSPLSSVLLKQKKETSATERLTFFGAGGGIYCTSHRIPRNIQYGS
jgi:hypothetical protein